MTTDGSNVLGAAPHTPTTPTEGGHGTDNLTGKVATAAETTLAGKPGSNRENPIVIIGTLSPAMVRALKEHFGDTSLHVAYKEDDAPERSDSDAREFGNQANPIVVESIEMATAIRERFAHDAGPYITIPDDAEIYGQDLSGLNLTRMVFKYKNMWEMDLSGADLRGSLFFEVLMERNTKVTGANMAGVRIIKSNLSNCDWSGVNFANACIERTLFLSSNLKDITLSGAQLSQVEIGGSSLAGANLVWASLYRLKANTYTDMKGANIWGTNIQGLEIENMSRQVPVGPATLEELGAVRRDPMVEENNRMLKEVLAKLGEKA